MRVKVIKSFCVGAGIDAAAGTIMDVDNHKAREWMHIGFVCIAHEDQFDDPHGLQPSADAHPELKSDQVVTQNDPVRSREPRRKRQTNNLGE